MLMSDRKPAFLYSSRIESLNYPGDCPFKTQRAGLTLRKLQALGLLQQADPRLIEPGPASLLEIQKFHAREYLDELKRASEGDLTVAGLQMGLGGLDTPVFKDMFTYGAWACGSALTAAELLLNGTFDIAFSLVGGFHHARRDHAAGFCYLNDAALACMHLAEAGRRVLYLDVDAHHGDGVQDAFYSRNDIFTISLHESGKMLFPWGGFETEIGEGPGVGFNANVCLPAGTFDDAFVAAFDDVVMPLLNAFGPDVIVLELGMDTLAGDPLTHLRMTNNIVVEVLERLLARRCPLLVLGGGGYHVNNTVRAWALAWRTCCGESDDDAFSLGLGGVMLGSTEWAGGLRDLDLAVSAAEKAAIQAELSASIRAVRDNVFQHHGLKTQKTAACE